MNSFFLFFFSIWKVFQSSCKFRWFQQFVIFVCLRTTFFPNFCVVWPQTEGNIQVSFKNETKTISIFFQQKFWVQLSGANLKILCLPFSIPRSRTKCLQACSSPFRLLSSTAPFTNVTSGFWAYDLPWAPSSLRLR